MRDTNQMLAALITVVLLAAGGAFGNVTLDTSRAVFELKGSIDQKWDFRDFPGDQITPLNSVYETHDVTYRSGSALSNYTIWGAALNSAGRNLITADASSSLRGDVDSTKQYSMLGWDAWWGGDPSDLPKFPTSIIITTNITYYSFTVDVRNPGPTFIGFTCDPGEYITKFTWSGGRFHYYPKMTWVTLGHISQSGVDIGVVKQVDDATPPEAGTVTSTIIARNGGLDLATGVEVTDFLPAGLNYSSSTATQGSYDDGSGVWTVGALASVQAETLSISATVAIGTGGSTITNIASVTAVDQADYYAANNTSSAAMNVPAIYDVVAIEGFTVQPIAMGLGPSGSIAGTGQNGYTTDLYVTRKNNQDIVRIDPSGTITSFVNLPGAAGLGSPTFDRVGNFGGELFVKVDPNGSYPKVIQRVQANGTVSAFNVSPALGTILGWEGFWIFFDPYGNFGGDLFMTYENDFGAGTVRIPSSGSWAPNFAVNIGGGETGPSAFSDGGFFGDHLYYAHPDSNLLYDLAPGHTPGNFANVHVDYDNPAFTFPISVEGLEISLGGVWGTDVSYGANRVDGTVLRFSSSTLLLDTLLTGLSGAVDLYLPPTGAFAGKMVVHELDAGNIWTVTPGSGGTFTALSAPGQNVAAQLGDSVAVQFDSVSLGGVTTLMESPVGPEPPAEVQVIPVIIPAYYDIETTSGYDGNIEVCVTYEPEGIQGSEADLRLYHYADPPGHWEDITDNVDTLANVICGTATSLSPFMVGEDYINPTSVAGADVTSDANDTAVLHPNGPNPFRSGTVIRYEIPRAAHVSLEVFNIAGRRIAVLESGPKTAGLHFARWDGRNVRGERTAAGIYLYRLQAGTFREVRKMTLVP